MEAPTILYQPPGRHKDHASPAVPDQLRPICQVRGDQLQDQLNHEVKKEPSEGCC
jgi:hypothetical protein